MLAERLSEPNCKQTRKWWQSDLALIEGLRIWKDESYVGIWYCCSYVDGLYRDGRDVILAPDRNLSVLPGCHCLLLRGLLHRLNHCIHRLISTVLFPTIRHGRPPVRVPRQFVADWELKTGDYWAMRQPLGG
jgi:hypothetical protein